MDTIAARHKKLLETGKGSDFIIRCKNGVELKAHKFILQHASDYFDRACNGAFKEGTTGILVLEDDEARFIVGVLEYIYHDCYTVRDSEGLPAFNDLVFHAKLAQLGQRFLIKGLQDRARVQFNAQCSGRKNTGGITDSLKEVAAVVYDDPTSFGKPFRQALARSLTIAAKKSADTNKTWPASLDDWHPFAADLLTAEAVLHAEMPKRKAWTCYCGAEFYTNLTPSRCPVCTTLDPPQQSPRSATLYKN